MATFHGSTGNDYLLGTDGADYLRSTSYLGSRVTGNDTLEGGAGNDWMEATDSTRFTDESPDVFVFGPGHGDDTVYGDFEPRDGAQDLIDLSKFGTDAPTWEEVGAHAYRSGNDITIDLRDFGGGFIRLKDVGTPLTPAHFRGLSHGGQGGPNELVYTNTVTGTPGIDRLYGTPGNDIMTGGAGRDLLAGGEGNDMLIGGPDGATLFGGPGADLFVFSGGQNWFMDYDRSQGDVIGGVGGFENLRALTSGQQVGGHFAIYFGTDPWDTEGPGTIWLANHVGSEDPVWVV